MSGQEKILRTQKISFVYAAQVPSGGIKIGISTNAERRRSELKITQKKRIKYIYIAKCMGNHAAAAIEKQAHALLWEKQIKGEWFSVNPDEAIGAIKKAAIQLEYEVMEMPLPEEKKVGRPPGRQFKETIPVRLTQELCDAINGWAESNGVSRSEAIRRLLELALKNNQN